MPPAINASLVRRLVAAQFPHWAHLAVTPVAHGGWDNRTFHLGEAMSVRLPSRSAYAAQVQKEQRWLPRLAPRLPLPTPEPLAVGRPGEDYPHPWSVLRWLPGEAASRAAIADPAGVARDVADFLVALQAIDAADGPAAGPHSFFRGGPLSTYDAETRAAVAALGRSIDARAALAVWDEALASAWTGPPVWVHGDVAAGNLLVEDGRLSAVIDFGCCAVGDPACDLAIAWTFFEGEARRAFRAALPLDAGTWARGRGWTLWKALILLAGGPPDHAETAGAARVLQAVLSDPPG